MKCLENFNGSVRTLSSFSLLGTNLHLPLEPSSIFAFIFSFPTIDT